MLIWWCIVILITAFVNTSSAFKPLTSFRNDDDFRFVAYHDLLTTAKRFSDHNVTTFSRMLFDVDRNAIVLGARNRIYRLSLQLDLMQRIEWEVPENVREVCLAKGQNENDCQNYIMSIHKYNNKLIICSTYAFSPKCAWRTINELNLIKEEASAGKSPFNPHSNFTSYVTNDGKMFVGAFVDFSGSDSAILRTDLSTENSKLLRTRQYNDIELYEPDFVGSFEHGDFVYFVFRETSIETASKNGKAKFSRIARVCKNDSGGVHILKENWTSFLKARLNCSMPGGDFPFYFNEIQDISYLADSGELYGVFTTPGNSIHGSAICVFNMSSIEKAFSGSIKYQEIVSGSPIWRTMKPQDGYFACNNESRSSSNLFDSSKYKLMDSAVQPMHLNPLYVEELEIFTHISVTKISTKLHESVPVIFVANKEGYVKKISVLPRTKQSCLIEVLELEKGIMKIESMKFVKASESLYVGTSNAFYQIPSQRCSRHISRVSCLNSMDPYCGWNDLAQKCSIAPNNDPLISHFYQNATTCPILSTPVDGSFSAWSPWFKCAKSGEEPITGEESSNNIDTCLCRTRTCDNPPPKNGGASCKGHTIIVGNCTTNGGWSEWSSWSACSQTCGVAIKVRRRTCTNPKPAFGGRTCVGVDRQEIYCTDLPPCPVPVPFSLAVDGGWGPFGDWSECTAPCGIGYRMRQRKCDDPIPANGGLECIGCNVEYEQCNKQPCIEVKKLGPFTPWLIVNNSDVGYMEKRFRYQCKATALSDPTGLKISLYKEETRNCNTDGGCHRMIEAPHKSSWGCWTDYSACSVTCGTGRRVRYRKCISTNGEVLSDKECDGMSVQEEICEMPNCDAPIGIDRETKVCSPVSEESVLAASSISIPWILILFLTFGIFCAILTYFGTKFLVERKFNRLRRIQGSPHYIPSNPNQYSSLPMKDFTDNKPKRQPSFSSSSSSKLINGHGTLNKSNNNLLNQNTPKILKFQNDTDYSTLKRNSALNNNMRLKQIDDDKDKY